MFVLILIVCDGLFDKVNGLNVGVDDYLFKLFEMFEFVVCVGVLLCCCNDLVEFVVCFDIFVGWLCMSGVEWCIFVDVVLLELLLCEFVVLELLMLC